MKANIKTDLKQFVTGNLPVKLWILAGAILLLGISLSLIHNVFFKIPSEDDNLLRAVFLSITIAPNMFIQPYVFFSLLGIFSPSSKIMIGGYRIFCAFSIIFFILSVLQIYRPTDEYFYQTSMLAGPCAVFMILINKAKNPVQIKGSKFQLVAILIGFLAVYFTFLTLINKIFLS